MKPVTGSGHSLSTAMESQGLPTSASLAAEGFKPVVAPKMFKNADGIYEHEKAPLRDRVAYPLRAIKNRIINTAVLGAVVGSVLGLSVPALVGSVVGGVAGGIVKLAKLLAGHESNARRVGSAIGLKTGALIGVPAAITLAAVSTVAFSVLALVANTVKLPVHIYNAATLDQSQLKPDHISFAEIKRKMEDVPSITKVRDAMRAG